MTDENDGVNASFLSSEIRWFGRKALTEQMHPPASL